MKIDIALKINIVQSSECIILSCRVATEEVTAEMCMLGISTTQAEENYDSAGSLVQEPQSEIMEERYSSIIAASTCQSFDEASQSLPFTPAPFQKIGACALASGHHVALRIATGCGKMSVPLLAIKMLNKTTPPGKVIITQPLDGLLMQSLQNSICKSASISMGGEVEYGGVRSGRLSHDLDYILSEEVEVIFGHPESFATPVGKQVLAELERRGKIKLIVFDEVHTLLHWSGFREDILRLSASIRAYAPSAPVCIMSATVTTPELRTLIKSLDLTPNPVLLANSPLQSHIKISFLRRPPNVFGVSGVEDEDGQVTRPGLIQMLERIYFDKMFADQAAGKEPKKAVIFFRGLEKQAAVAAYLRSRTGQRSAKEACFVSIHSELRPPTVRQGDKWRWPGFKIMVKSKNEH